MRRLELEFRIENVSVLYEENPASWDNAEFIFNADFTANLKVWEDDIEPEQILETWKRLEERGESFRVAFRYKGNRSITFKNRNGWPTYYFDGRTFTPRTEKEISLLIDYLRGRRDTFSVVHVVLPKLTVNASGTTSPAPLPQSMPSIPHHLCGMAETLIIAEDLEKYPDSMLKLAFLILEELKGENAFNPAEQNIKYARDFVSHSTCKYSKVIAFVEGELPTAKVSGGVQFKRDKSDHMSFVSTYAYQALSKAKELFDEKVRQDGGFVKD